MKKELKYQKEREKGVGCKEAECRFQNIASEQNCNAPAKTGVLAPAYCPFYQPAS